MSRGRQTVQIVKTYERANAMSPKQNGNGCQRRCCGIREQHTNSPDAVNLRSGRVAVDVDALLLLRLAVARGLLEEPATEKDSTEVVAVGDAEEAGGSEPLPDAEEAEGAASNNDSVCPNNASNGGKMPFDVTRAE